MPKISDCLQESIAAALVPAFEPSQISIVSLWVHSWRRRESFIGLPGTLNQAAIYLGLTADALKAKVHMGRIPTVDLDKKLRFDKLDLDRIIEESKKVA